MIFSEKCWHGEFALNSLAPGGFEWSFTKSIFNVIWVIHGSVITCEIALGWKSLDLTDDKSTLLKVMS